MPEVSEEAVAMTVELQITIELSVEPPELPAPLPIPVPDKTLALMIECDEIIRSLSGNLVVSHSRRKS
jgi:hypothetical protein